MGDHPSWRLIDTLCSMNWRFEFFTVNFIQSKVSKAPFIFDSIYQCYRFSPRKHTLLPTELVCPPLKLMALLLWVSGVCVRVCGWVCWLCDGWVGFCVLVSMCLLIFFQLRIPLNSFKNIYNFTNICTKFWALPLLSLSPKRLSVLLKPILFNKPAPSRMHFSPTALS